jgi:hypothetical protein
MYIKESLLYSDVFLLQQVQVWSHLFSITLCTQSIFTISFYVLGLRDEFIPINHRPHKARVTHVSSLP